MSESGANDACRQYLAAEQAMLDGGGQAVIDETIDVMTVAMHNQLKTYDEASPGSNVRVQALRAAVEIAEKRLLYMRQSGRAPRSERCRQKDAAAAGSSPRGASRS